MPYLELDIETGSLIAYTKERRNSLTDADASPTYYKGRGGFRIIPLSVVLLVEYVEGSYRITDAAVEPETPTPTASYALGSLMVTLITGETIRFSGTEYDNVKDIAEDYCAVFGVTYIDPLSFTDEETTP